MTITEARKRLEKAIKKLNASCSNLVFEIEETEYSIGFTNHGKRNPASSYGAYTQISIFNEYKEIEDAYINTAQAAEMLILGISLNDPKAYHNVKESV